MSPAALMAIDLATSYLKYAMKMNELVTRANAEGREVNMDDVKKLAAENEEKRKQIFGD